LYADDLRVGSISGTNVRPSTDPLHSHFFSRFPFIWGWATWARTWELYDKELISWSDAAVREAVGSMFSSKAEFAYWDQAFRSIQNGFDTWDYQLSFTLFKHKMFSVIPAVNLVSNLGFRSDATHTTSTNSSLAKLKIERLENIEDGVLGVGVVPSHDFDEFIASTYFSLSRKARLRELFRTSLAF
jgi:hypothetical protein